MPTATNPLGAKGCGEAGCAGSLPAVMNAVVDALSGLGIRHIDMPATPQAIWQRIAAGRGNWARRRLQFAPVPDQAGRSAVAGRSR